MKSLLTIWYGKRNTLLFILSSLLLCFLPACQPETIEEPIKIGVIAYMKGDLIETEGLPTVNAARMALRDFERDGGLVVNGVKKKVELVFEEIGQVKEEAVAATRKLINREGVVAIVGPQYSSDGIPSGAVAEQSRVPMICPVSTNPAVTRNRNYVFRMSFLDPVQGAAMANLAIRDLKAKKAAILFNEADEYSRGIASVFEKVFAENSGSVFVEKYIPGDADLKEKLERIKSVKPDVLYLPSFHKEVVGHAALAREIGIKATLLGTDGWDQRLVPNLKDFNDSYYSLHWSPLVDTDESRLFIENYQNKFNLQPNGTAALSYDAIQLVLRSMQLQQKTDSEAVRDGLLKLSSYPGVAGDIDFVDSGDPQKRVLIVRVKDGENRFFRFVN